MRDRKRVFSIVHLLQNIHISIASILECEWFNENWIEEVNAFFLFKIIIYRKQFGQPPFNLKSANMQIDAHFKMFKASRRYATSDFAVVVQLDSSFAITVCALLLDRLLPCNNVCHGLYFIFYASVAFKIQYDNMMCDGYFDKF